MANPHRILAANFDVTATYPNSTRPGNLNILVGQEVIVGQQDGTTDAYVIGDDGIPVQIADETIDLVQSLISSGIYGGLFNGPAAVDFSDTVAVSALDLAKLALGTDNIVRRYDGADWVQTNFNATFDNYILADYASAQAAQFLRPNTVVFVQGLRGGNDTFIVTSENPADWAQEEVTAGQMDGPVYLRTASLDGTTPLNLKRFGVKEITSSMFGMLDDNVTDNRDQLRRFVDYAYSHKRIQNIQGLGYSLSGGVFSSRGNQTIRFDRGTRLVSEPGVRALTFRGSTEPFRVLTASMAEGSNDVLFDNADGLVSQGDFIIVGSFRDFAPERQNPRAGLGFLVQRARADGVFTGQSAEYDLDLADDAHILKVNPIENVHIIGAVFDPDENPGVDRNIGGILIEHGRNCIIENAISRDVTDNSIALNHSLDCLILNPVIDRGFGGNGYGIVIGGASRSVNTRGAMLGSAEHGYQLTGDSGDLSVTNLAGLAAGVNPSSGTPASCDFQGTVLGSIDNTQQSSNRPPVDIKAGSASCRIDVTVPHGAGQELVNMEGPRSELIIRGHSSAGVVANIRNYSILSSRHTIDIIMTGNIAGTVLTAQRPTGGNPAPSAGPEEYLSISISARNADNGAIDYSEYQHVDVKYLNIENAGPRIIRARNCGDLNILHMNASQAVNALDVANTGRIHVVSASLGNISGNTIIADTCEELRVSSWTQEEAGADWLNSDNTDVCFGSGCIGLMTNNNLCQFDNGLVSLSGLVVKRWIRTAGTINAITLGAGTLAGSRVQNVTVHEVVDGASAPAQLTRLININAGAGQTIIDGNYAPALNLINGTPANATLGTTNVTV